MKEYIICAAIWFQDEQFYEHQPINITSGIVICGRRHHNCILTLSAIGGKLSNYTGHVQGFLTNTDRFVNRKEGGIIALEAGQIDKETTCLFSEDLY